MKEALVSSGKDRKPAKVFSHMELRPSENGGAIADHHFTSYEHKPEPYTFGPEEGKKLAAHVLEHMGMSRPEADDETGGAIADKKGGGAEADAEMGKK